MELLKINNLKTSFKTHAGEVQAVRGISLKVGKGETIGIVGESGCGKSVTMMSVLGLLPDNGFVKDGEIIFDNENILTLKNKKMEHVRGNLISMIFQDPMTSLNPLFRVGDQLTEHLCKHKKISKADATKKAIELLTLVGIPDPSKRMKQYPHEFSGGMRQRIMISMALVTDPKMLIADEPTTALDVTIQAQILDLLKEIKGKLETSIILITHDLAVVADMCDRIYVMYGGLIVEEGTVSDIFYNPNHPYTWGLLKSIPNPKSQNKDKLIPINGYPPNLIKPPTGCPFAKRCKFAMEICEQQVPDYFEVEENHMSSCWLLHPQIPVDMKQRWEGLS